MESRPGALEPLEGGIPGPHNFAYRPKDGMAIGTGRRGDTRDLDWGSI